MKLFQGRLKDLLIFKTLEHGDGYGSGSRYGHGSGTYFGSKDGYGSGIGDGYGLGFVDGYGTGYGIITQAYNRNNNILLTSHSLELL